MRSRATRIMIPAREAVSGLRGAHSLRDELELRADEAAAARTSLFGQAVQHERLRRSRRRAAAARRARSRDLRVPRPPRCRRRARPWRGRARARRRAARTPRGSVSRWRSSSPGRTRLAASITTLRCSERSSSSSRRPAAASATTLLCSGSKASTTSCCSATASAAAICSTLSRHASGLALAGCARHMSSGSREPVHSVTTRVPSRGAAAIRAASRAAPSARTAGSGWAMLYVPETAAMVRPRAATAARTSRSQRRWDLDRQRRPAGDAPC